MPRFGAGGAGRSGSQKGFMNRILLVDPEEQVRVLLSSILRESGFEVLTKSSMEDCIETLRERPDDFSLLLLSVSSETDEAEALNSVRAAKKARPDLPVIAVTAMQDEEFGESLHKAGAVDVIERSPYSGRKIEISMKSILSLKDAVEENSSLQKTVTMLKSNLRYYHEFFKSRYEPVGVSEAFRGMMRKAEELAFIPRPVLIVGERGTGKEIVAGAIHYMGDRAAAPFVTINCAAFNGELLASELFGHEKGAFTGAHARKPGRFELADRGTLFLDEIGNMPVEFQEKILRIIEYQEFERLGGTELLKVDVRVIAATNTDMAERISEGRFRADLYDRLTFETVSVPPLRDRPEDIEPLIEHFTRKFTEEVPHIHRKLFSPAAMEKMKRCRWPGNIRELRNLVERLLCSSKSPEIGAEEIPADAAEAPYGGSSLPEKVDSFEKKMVLDALAAEKYNQKKAAESLGITYDQFRHLYKKHRIKDLS